MYARFSRRFCKKFVSLITSCKNEHIPITSAYRQPSGIISVRLTNSLTRSFPNLSLREVNTTATMSSQGKFNVNYEQVLEAQKDSNVLIVDVREQSEINETGKLPGSIHIPMGNVSSTLQNLSEEDFMERYGKPKPTKNTKIIFSCRSGKRSGMVQEQMQKLGYDKYNRTFKTVGLFSSVFSYTGGWMDWESKQKA